MLVSHACVVNDLACSTFAACGHTIPDRQQDVCLVNDMRHVGTGWSRAMCRTRQEVIQMSNNNSGPSVVISGGPTAHVIGPRAIRNEV
jgi:hypothetical protein